MQELQTHDLKTVLSASVIMDGRNEEVKEIPLSKEVIALSKLPWFSKVMRELGYEPVVRCKECKYFLYDKLYMGEGLPLMGNLVCTKWGNGCRTDANGYCFVAERREYAEPVVKCKDCKYFDHSDFGKGEEYWCKRFVSTDDYTHCHKVSEDGFCAWGERRENG